MVVGGVRAVGAVVPCPIKASAWTNQMIRSSDVVGRVGGVVVSWGGVGGNSVYRPHQ